MVTQPLKRSTMFIGVLVFLLSSMTFTVEAMRPPHHHHNPRSSFDFSMRRSHHHHNPRSSVQAMRPHNTHERRSKQRVEAIPIPRSSVESTSRSDPNPNSHTQSSGSRNQALVDDFNTTIHVLEAYRKSTTELVNEVDKLNLGIKVDFYYDTDVDAAYKKVHDNAEAARIQLDTVRTKHNGIFPKFEIPFDIEKFDEVMKTKIAYDVWIAAKALRTKVKAYLRHIRTTRKRVLGK